MPLAVDGANSIASPLYPCYISKRISMFIRGINSEGKRIQMTQA